jgi:hypothetical protein
MECKGCKEKKIEADKAELTVKELTAYNPARLPLGELVKRRADERYQDSRTEELAKSLLYDSRMPKSMQKIRSSRTRPRSRSPQDTTNALSLDVALISDTFCIPIVLSPASDASGIDHLLTSFSAFTAPSRSPLHLLT